MTSALGRAKEITALMSVIQDINARSNGKQAMKPMAMVKLITYGSRFPGWLISFAICIALKPSATPISSAKCIHSIRDPKHPRGVINPAASAEPSFCDN